MTTLALKLPSRVPLAALACAALFIAVFWPTFAWMAERFDAHDSFYSHGWLIPFASGWLIWQRRDRLPGRGAVPSYAGLTALALSLGLHVVATWWRIGFVSGFAMVFTVWSLVWTVWGWTVLRRLAFPLLFLLFMVPLPGVLLIAVSFYMKLAAASLATALINLFGMPAVQSGSTIQIPGVSVIVDDTCSGLRSLISLIALSTLWTALMPASSKLWQKLTVVAASIPIALAANMVRIILLVYIAAIYGAKAAEGFIHFGSGVVVFGVALLALGSLSGWLTRSGR
jgi:exosortase